MAPRGASRTPVPSPAKRKASNLDDDSSGDESETLKAAVLAIDAPIGAPGTNQGAPDDASTVHVRHCFTTYWTGITMNNQKVREKDDPTRTIIAYTSVPSGLDVRHTLLELNMSPKNTENSDQFLFEEGDTVGYVGKGQWAVGGRASLPLMVPAPVMHSNIIIKQTCAPLYYDRFVEHAKALADKLGFKFELEDLPDKYTKKIVIYLTENNAILIDADTIDPLFLTLKETVGYFKVDVIGAPGDDRDARGTPAWKFDRRLHAPLKRTLEKLGFDVRTKVA